MFRADGIYHVPVDLPVLVYRNVSEPDRGLHSMSCRLSDNVFTAEPIKTFRHAHGRRLLEIGHDMRRNVHAELNGPLQVEDDDVLRSWSSCKTRRSEGVLAMTRSMQRSNDSIFARKISLSMDEPLAVSMENHSGQGHHVRLVEPHLFYEQGINPVIRGNDLSPAESLLQDGAGYGLEVNKIHVPPQKRRQFSDHSNPFPAPDRAVRGNRDINVTGGCQAAMRSRPKQDNDPNFRDRIKKIPDVGY